MKKPLRAVGSWGWALQLVWHDGELRAGAVILSVALPHEQNTAWFAPAVFFIQRCVHIMIALE
jgi:hypothetical protein